MLTTEDSNYSVSAGCCAAVNRSRCTEENWSCCLVQQDFLPNLFALREAENIEAKTTAHESKGSLPATLFYLTLSISCLSVTISGYFLVPGLDHGSEILLESSCCYSL